jgi:gluconokinase
MNRNLSDAWYLGIDLGTGSCKSVIVDPEGKVLGFGVGQYESSDVQAKWREQNPEAMVSGLVQSAKAAMDDAAVSPDRCAGLSLGAALHGILAIDKKGKPLTGVMTWADDRASHQAKKIKGEIDPAVLYQETGCPVHWMYPLYKILWIREEEPDIFRAADRFISAKEYMTKRLTGQYMVDYALASGTGLLNVRTLTWNTTALDLAGIRAEQLSQLCSPKETISEIDPELARQIGIPETTPFVLGSSDAANSNFGAGAVHAWQGTCMIGTSGAFRIISPKPILDPLARGWCYVFDDDHWLVGGAINNGGVALSWLQDAFNSAVKKSKGAEPLSFDDLIRLAEQAGCGAQGVLCLPFFAGERSPNWNLNSRAMFFGLTLKHDARHMARALLEGVSFRMRNLGEILEEISGDIRQIRASGGFTRSSFWLQILSDTINREMVVPAWGETSGRGAAFWAMLGTGVLSDITEVIDKVELSETFLPNEDRAHVYDNLFDIYKSLYGAVSPYFEGIAKIQEKLTGKNHL